MSTRRLALALIFVTVAVSPSLGQPSKYTLENAHSSMVFGVGHLGLSYTYGRFNQISGEFTWDNSDPAQCAFKVTVDTASVDTNEAKRDEHLRSADFFDVAQFPTIEFVSTGLEKTEAGWDLAGKLTLHGVTKEIKIPLVKVGEAAGPQGDYRAGFLSQFSLKRSEYGMTGAAGMVGDDVTITFSFEGVRQPAEGQ